MWLCFFQAEDGIRDLVRSRGLGDVYKRQDWLAANWDAEHGKALFPYLPSIRKDVEFVGRQVPVSYTHLTLPTSDLV